MLEPIKPEDIKQEKVKDQRLFAVIPYRALNDKGFTIQRMRALIACCSYARHNGTLWPGVERLAEDLGITKATMQAHVRWLTVKGYLVTINNSYQVGKHAKPRAIVYDVDNPPISEVEQQIAQDYQEVLEDSKSLKEERDTLVQAKQSANEVLAKPTSLYRVWNDEIRARFSLDHPYDKALYIKLAGQYSLNDFKKATQALISTKASPPASASILLKR